MNENNHKDNTEGPERTRCTLKLPNQEPMEAECYISEGNLVISGRPPIVIPLHRIQSHTTGGIESREWELTYVDDLKKSHRLALAMANPQYFKSHLDIAIEKVKPQRLKSLPIEERYKDSG